METADNPYTLACEQAHLRENWGKEKKRRGGGGGRERKGKMNRLMATYTLFQKPGASMESRHCGQEKRILFYLLSCPQCLDSMLAPGFWNKVYC